MGKMEVAQPRLGAHERRGPFSETNIVEAFGRSSPATLQQPFSEPECYGWYQGSGDRLWNPVSVTQERLREARRTRPWFPLAGEFRLFGGPS